MDAASALGHQEDQLQCKFLKVCLMLVQVTPQKGNTAQAAGNEMDLVQWHFHTPSEHTFDGQKKSMEAHLVHKDRRTGTLHLSHNCTL